MSWLYCVPPDRLNQPLSTGSSTIGNVAASTNDAGIVIDARSPSQEIASGNRWPAASRATAFV